ncbi:MAG: hypothetical protein NVSMB1_17820 [Polyangiales bacterium]
MAAGPTLRRSDTCADGDRRASTHPTNEAAKPTFKRAKSTAQLPSQFVTAPPLERNALHRREQAFASVNGSKGGAFAGGPLGKSAQAFSIIDNAANITLVKWRFRRADAAS